MENTLKLNSQPINLNAHLTRLGETANRLGQPKESMVRNTATPGGKFAAKAAMLLGTLTIAAGLAYSPNTEAAPSIGSAPIKVSHVHSAEDYAQQRIQTAYDALIESLGWKALVDSGVASKMPSDMLPSNQYYLTAGEVGRGEYVQAASYAQSMLDENSTPAQVEAVQIFSNSIINALPSEKAQNALRSALEREAALINTRLKIRDQISNLDAPGVSLPDMTEVLFEVTEDHADALRSIEGLYRVVAESSGHTDIAADIIISAGIQADLAKERVTAAKDAALHFAKHTGSWSQTMPHEDMVKSLKHAAYSVVDDDMGQRAATKEEFFLARRDASGNVLPGEINLDEPAETQESYIKRERMRG